MQLPDNIQRSKSRRVFLVGVIIKGQPGSAAQVEEHLDELAQLADSAGSRVVGRAVQARQAPDAATFIGKGKAAEIAAAATELDADLLLFDDDLSAGQVKALEEATSLAILDRSGLILEIFDQRAKSREARTQVELARLNYLLPRLTKRWSHLSRQAGGVGTRGGEGEKQLEQDRRVLRARIRRLEQELARIDRTRGVQRHGRRGMPVVALTGYTNAGREPPVRHPRRQAAPRQPRSAWRGRRGRRGRPGRRPGRRLWGRRRRRGWRRQSGWFGERGRRGRRQGRRGPECGLCRHRRFHPQAAAPPGLLVPQHSGRDHRRRSGVARRGPQPSPVARADARRRRGPGRARGRAPAGRHHLQQV